MIRVLLSIFLCCSFTTALAVPSTLELFLHTYINRNVPNAHEEQFRQFLKESDAGTQLFGFFDRTSFCEPIRLAYITMIPINALVDTAKATDQTQEFENILIQGLLDKKPEAHIAYVYLKILLGLESANAMKMVNLEFETLKSDDLCLEIANLAQRLSNKRAKEGLAADPEGEKFFRKNLEHKQYRVASESLYGLRELKGSDIIALIQSKEEPQHSGDLFHLGSYLQYVFAHPNREGFRAPEILPELIAVVGSSANQWQKEIALMAIAGIGADPVLTQSTLDGLAASLAGTDLGLPAQNSVKVFREIQCQLALRLSVNT